MKRLALAVGCAFVAVTVAASAQHIRIERGNHAEIDANDDGWLSRDEAAAAAERAFEHLDRNNDGLLSDADHEEFREAMREARERAREAREAARERAREAREEAREAREEARRVHRLVDRTVVRHRDGNREIIIIRGGADDDLEGALAELDIEIPEPPVPPLPPMPAIPAAPAVPAVPAPPPFAFMMFGDPGEADLNGDGGLSLDEFRAQQLRYFDASDVNRDGRIRLTRRREAEPPEPPAPPASPRRR